MVTQLVLIEETKEERIGKLEKALRKLGRHSVYCGWNSDGGYYDRRLGCTCGLSEALGEEEDRV